MKRGGAVTSRAFGRALVALVLAALAAQHAAAQGLFSKPIRLVIPFPAGSTTDVLFRPLAEHMGGTLGQTIIMDAKPGSGSMVASLFVKRAPADGQYIYLVTNTAVTKSLLPDSDIDVRKDFTHIVAVDESPLIVAVNSDQIKATSIKELVEEARRRPGELNYASTGVGSGAHLFVELLANEAKVKFTHVPYTGTAQGTADVAAGRLQFTGTVLAALRPYVASLGGSGRLRMLGVSSLERSSLTPDLPGMREAGYPQAVFSYWGAIVGPPGMARPMVDALNRAGNLALKDPKNIEVLARAGQTPLGGTPEDLTRRIAQEYDAYARLIHDTGLKLE
jgi:tripartite-type tricarboxylate transporter receptor subunit TctC